MFGLFLLVSYVVSRYIFVELDDQNLHVLNRDTGEEVDTINMQNIVSKNMRLERSPNIYNIVTSMHSCIENASRDMESDGVRTGLLQTSSATNTYIDYYKTKTNGEKIDIHEKPDTTGMPHVSTLPGHSMYSAFVDNRGYICFMRENLHINTGISLREILDEPRIIGNSVFMASKENIVLTVQNVNIFMVKIKVEIVEIRAQCKRTIDLVYIHSPFSSSCCDLEVADQTIRLRQANIARTFGRKVVGVYECKKHEECVYLSRVYPGSSVALYHRREVPAPYASYYYVALFPAIILLFLVLRGRRKIRVARILYEAKGYKVAEGDFDKSTVTIKIYRRNDERIHSELKFLAGHRHHCIIRYIYKEHTNKYLYIAFEHTYGLKEVTIMDRRKFYKELVDVLLYLHSEGFVYNNIAPDNVRVSHTNSPILMNFEDINSERSRMGTVNWRSAEVILNEFGIQKIAKETMHKSDVFSLGLLLYYLEYDKHPFEMYDSEENAGDDENEAIEDSRLNNEDLVTHDGVTDAQETSFVAHDSTQPIAKTRKTSIVYSGQGEFLVSGIEQNILAGKFKLSYVCDQTFYFLITHCIKRGAEERYSMELVRHHPYFWSDHKVFNFLANISDILENRGADGMMLCRRLERNRYKIFKDTWMGRLDRTIVDNLCSRRAYNQNSVQSLLRAIRNKGRHYKELPEDIKMIYKTFPGGFVEYYMQLFPRLLMVCYISASCIALEESLAAFYPQNKPKL
eukprot:jgi/Antlo1/879/438